MQSQEINNLIVDPTAEIVDKEFFKLVFSQIKDIAAQINCKISDNQIKIECFRSLDFAMYYLAQALRKQAPPSNSFLTR